MITGRQVTYVYWAPVCEAMCRCFNITEDDAMFGLFGDTPHEFQTVNATVTKPKKKLIEYDKLGDYISDQIISELCRLGEIEPGEYIIKLS